MTQSSAQSAARQTLSLRVAGMDCPSCAATIDKALGRLDGVVEAQTNFVAGRVEATIDPSRVDRESVTARIREVGYEVSDDDGDGRAGGGLLATAAQRRRLAATIVAGVLLIAGGLVGWLADAAAVAVAVALYLAATAVGGYYVVRAAIGSIRTRQLDMNVLMTIAVAGALAIGYWSEAATVTFLFALSLLLEQMAMDRARRAIHSLMKLRPDRVRVLRTHDGHTHEQLIEPEQVNVGERIQVRPSERIGLDGRVVEGISSVDQSAVTGESAPAGVEGGDDVLAGTINLEATLTVEVTRPAGESTLSKIIELVEQAQAARAPAQRFVDKFAKVYTPIVVAAAVLVAAVPPLLFGQPFLEPADAALGSHGWLYRALVLLVIACPCALVISTPVSVVSGLTSAARSGVLIKGGIHLETLGRVHCVVFDKTGTLTVGRPEVTDVAGIGNVDENRLLSMAAALEGHSEHHLARAILHEAERRGIDWPTPAEISVRPGRGVVGQVDGQSCWLGNARLAREQGADPSAEPRVGQLEAQGKTLVLLGSGAQLLGLIAVADRPRDEAADSLAALRDQSHLHGRGGAKVDGNGRPHHAHLVMLTGDNEPTAAAIAQRLGLDGYSAELLPDEKVARVRELAAGCTGAVAMVGDGINDAPALAASDLGIAMGAGGTDAAIQTADVALIGDDLGGVPFAVKLGRRTRRIIAENVWFSIGIKAVFFGLAVTGHATLWMAVFADMGASLIVTGNGLRLLWAKRN